MENTTCFNIDWLSIYGISNFWNAVDQSFTQKDGDFMSYHKDIEFGTEYFEFVLMPYGTKQFRHIYSIIPRGTSLTCAMIQCHPRSGILKPNAIIIKLANFMLYSNDLKEQLKNLFTQCKIQPLSISRIDLALDFYQFDNGWTAPEFIDKYMKREIIHVGRGKSQLFMIEGKCAMKYTGLQFGEKSSAANVYLYNKTLELSGSAGAGHHDKPYIRQCWKENGLNEEGKDVWRLEISFKPEALKFADKKTKAVMDFSKIDTLDNVPLLFNIYINKLFKFVFPTNRNISRCERVDLFNGIPDINRITINVKRCSLRSDKIFIKKLLTCLKYEKIREDDKMFQDAVKIACGVIESCDLSYWFNKQGRDWDVPEELKEYLPLKRWIAQQEGKWDLLTYGDMEHQMSN